MDLTTIAIIVVVVIILLVVFMLRRNTTGTTGAGPLETPRYNNPNITSGGSFGGGPAVGDSSPFGTSVGGGSEIRQDLRDEAPPPAGGEHPRNDNPNIRSGGSFGG